MESRATSLRAISIAESGRWLRSRKATLAWPWTVTSGGKGTYYKSKSAAIRAVRKLQRRGVRNIDVGCMQVIYAITRKPSNRSDKHSIRRPMPPMRPVSYGNCATTNVLGAKR